MHNNFPMGKLQMLWYILVYNIPDKEMGLCLLNRTLELYLQARTRNDYNDDVLTNYVNQLYNLIILI